ncbi:asparagine synthase-related protein, partial [bacterium]|nr:asparagine synthase-related protein [bacterium]
KLVDTSNTGNQPFVSDDSKIVLVANAEIYNHNALKLKYKLKTKSGSDCEVILRLYEKLKDFSKVLYELDGVYSIVLMDSNTNSIYAARDPFGIRPLFIGYNTLNGNIIDIGLSSELKGLINLFNFNTPVPPNSNWSILSPHKFNTTLKYLYNFHMIKQSASYEEAKHVIKALLSYSVKKRLMGNRSIGCFLSGGLDSSLVAALVCKELKTQVNTYSIGLKGSTDLKYAKQVADYIGSKHHEIIFTEQEGIAAIDHVIYSQETFDITTVRAGVPMWLLSQYISKYTKDVIIFTGEGSDELFQGYIYFHKAPNDTEAKQESIRLLKNLYLFDVLRCDRTTAAHGLEVRVPILDLKLVDYCLNLDDSYLRPIKGIEKYILRDAFKYDKLIPDSVLWRPKEAFSDGVSGVENSWYKIIQKYVDTKINASKLSNNFSHIPAKTKEGYYYRKIFNGYFHNKNSHIIPYYWMPKWSNTDDPSARTLEWYT